MHLHSLASITPLFLWCLAAPNPSAGAALGQDQTDPPRDGWTTKLDFGGLNRFLAAAGDAVLEKPEQKWRKRDKREAVTLCSHFWSTGSFIHSLSSPMAATGGWASLRSSGGTGAELWVGSTCTSAKRNFSSELVRPAE